MIFACESLEVSSVGCAEVMGGGWIRTFAIRSSVCGTLPLRNISSSQFWYAISHPIPPIPRTLKNG